MSANTSPDNITYPTSGDNVAPLETVFATMAASVQTALTSLRAAASVTDLTALAALTGNTSGKTIAVQEGEVIYIYNGTAFIQITTAVFSSVSARNTAYAKASGVYLVVGATALDTSTGITSRYNGSAWKPWDSDWITFVPTLTGITVGNGTNTGQYKFSAGVLTVEGKFIMGSTSAMSSNPTITHPNSYLVSAFEAIDPYPLGRADVLKSGISVSPGFVTTNGTNNNGIFNVIGAGGTYGVLTRLSSVIPITWATLDTLFYSYSFVPA